MQLHEILKLHEELEKRQSYLLSTDKESEEVILISIELAHLEELEEIAVKKIELLSKLLIESFLKEK